METVLLILVVLLIAWNVYNGFRQRAFYQWADRAAADVRAEFARHGPGWGNVPTGPTGLP